jgi:hypothetical protein
MTSVTTFLKQHFAPQFYDSAIVASLQGYYYEFPNGPHREFYTMFANGDTVYVISGLFGKFISFYRATPGDFRLEPDKLLTEVRKISSLIDGLEIGADDFVRRDDPGNYFLEYVNRDALVRIRNYQMKAILPPDPPDTTIQETIDFRDTRKPYNLIEVTKIIDGSIIPTRR